MNRLPLRLPHGVEADRSRLENWAYKLVKRMKQGKGLGKSEGPRWKASASILALVVQGERRGRRGSACGGERDWVRRCEGVLGGVAGERAYPSMPLSELYDKRVYVGGCEGLW